MKHHRALIAGLAMLISSTSCARSVFPRDPGDGGGTDQGGAETDAACAIGTPRPAGLWRGEGNLVDSIAGNDAVGSAVTFAPGQVGQAIVRNAAANVTAPGRAIVPGSRHSMTLWYRIDAGAPSVMEEFLAGFGQPGTVGAAFLLTVSGGTSGRIAYSDWGNGIFGPTLSPGTWHHVAATTDGRLAILFFDGIEVQRGMLTNDVVLPGSVLFGAIADDPNRRFSGSLDEVAVYNEPLTASRIRALFEAGRAGRCSE